jgi:hypothetical protein
LKITSLAIGLLSIISIAPATQASTTANASIMEQPAGNIHAQINIHIGNPVRPPFEPVRPPFEQGRPTVFAPPWRGPARPGFVRPGRFGYPGGPRVRHGGRFVGPLGGPGRRP